MSTRDLRKSVGMGLPVDTLIGPLRLDFGADEENRYRVCTFQRGLIFGKGNRENRKGRL